MNKIVSLDLVWLDLSIVKISHRTSFFFLVLQINRSIDLWWIAYSRLCIGLYYFARLRYATIIKDSVLKSQMPYSRVKMLYKMLHWLSKYICSFPINNK